MAKILGWRDRIVGDISNGVTPEMEHVAYGDPDNEDYWGTEQVFEFEGKVRILTHERLACEWLQPVAFVKEFASGVILLESVYTCSLRNYDTLLSRSSQLSEWEKQAREFL